MLRRQYDTKALMKTNLRRLLRRFNKWFDIRTPEWPLVLFFMLLATLTNAGAIWGMTIVYAAFLQQIGLAALPWVMVLSALLSVVAVVIYSAFVDRVANRYLLVAILGVEILGIGFGLGLLAAGQTTLAYPFLYLLLMTAIAVVNPHQITYFNSFFDTRAAKRTLPLITAGYRLGAIAAGASVPLFSLWIQAESWLNTGIIILAWLLAHSLVIALVLAGPRLRQRWGRAAAQLEPVATAAGNTATTRWSYLNNLREGLGYTWQSAYLRWLALSMLLMMTLMSLLEYRYSEILLAAYGTVDELAIYIGFLASVGNLFVLPMLLFGVSRLISRLGLANAGLLFPGTTLVISGSLVALPTTFTASLAYLDRSAFRLAFQAPVEGLLYNAVPLRIQGRARAFVSGLIVPIGSLLGGLLLLLPSVSLSWFVPSLIGVFAVAYMLASLRVRQQYSQALITMLEQDDYAALFALQANEFNVADPRALATLESRLQASNDPDFALFLGQLIAQVGGANAGQVLARYVTASPDPELQAGMLRVMVAGRVHGPDVLRLYEQGVSSSDPVIRHQSLLGLEQQLGADSGRFQDTALVLLNDTNTHVQLEALQGLARGGQLFSLSAAVKNLDKHLRAVRSQDQAMAVAVLGQLPDERAWTRLQPFLHYYQDQVRLAAITATGQLLERLKSASLIRQVETSLPQLLQDRMEQIRLQALELAGRLNSPHTRMQLLDALQDNSLVVRQAAIDTMATIGAPMLPHLSRLQHATDPRLRLGTLQALIRIDPQTHEHELQETLHSLVAQIYQQHHDRQHVPHEETFKSLAVLRDSLYEREQRTLDDLSALLGAWKGHTEIQVIREALQSRQERTRANGLEALEALIGAQLSGRLGPLFVAAANPEYHLPAISDSDSPAIKSPATLLEYLAGPNSKTDVRAIALFTLGEIAAARNRAAIEAATEPKPRRKPRRQRPSRANLLAALDGDPAPEPETASEPEPPPKPPPPKSGPDLSDSTRWPENTRAEALITAALEDASSDIQRAARSAQRLLAGVDVNQIRLSARAANRLNTDNSTGNPIDEETFMLSAIEKVIFLKNVPFFANMTVSQLQTLAGVAEEVLFETDARIFEQGDSGGTLYVVVSGKVALEQEGRRRDSVARLGTIGPYAYFGEMNLFDDSPRSASAIAVQDTLTLKLSRDPLVALTRRYPDLSIALIQVLSERLREANEQIAGMTRAKPRALHKLYDTLE